MLYSVDSVLFRTDERHFQNRRPRVSGSDTSETMNKYLLDRSIKIVAAILLCFASASFAYSQTKVETQPDPGLTAVSEKEKEDTTRKANADEIKRVRHFVETETEKKPLFETGTDKLKAESYFDPVPETVVPKKKQATDGWQFAFTPYLFATGVSGTVGANGRELEVDANFGNVWENLDIGLMGTFEARKGRFVMFTDLFWSKLSAERDTAGPLYSTAKLGINIFIFDPEFGYRLIDSEKGSLDVLGGVRIWSVENNINVTTGILPGFDVSKRKSWAAPVVGLKGNVNLTRRFFLGGKFDIGGAGIGADLTTQLFGGAGYRITKNIALVGGYRWLQVDYDDDEGFIFDTQMSGLLFGAKFSF